MENSRRTYTYEEAFRESVQYFNGDELASKVFLDKYALRDNEDNILEDTPDKMHQRLAKEFARIEKTKFKKPLTEETIYEYIKDFKRIIPQGSPMYGIGNPYQYISTSNCFVIDSPEDSYAGILKTDEEIVQISKRRGGVGLDMSTLRPKHTRTTNAAKTSTGIISFLNRFSNTIREVGQHGRRGALLVSLSAHHPDIIDFITSKKDLTKVIGANISVRLSDEFLNAVKNNTTYELRWPVDSNNPVISKQVDAKEVWDIIIESAWASAEPGLLFWDTIINESPTDCYSKFGFNSLTTNPCGEIILCSNDSCRLLALCLYSYVEKPFSKDAYFNFEKFYADAKIAQRFQDNIIDLEIEAISKIIQKVKNDPEDKDIKIRELELWNKILEKAKQGRRTGTGITALGDTLAALNIKYGSEESIQMVEKIYKTLKLGCYESSVEMAEELGAFPIWDYDLEKNNPFLNRITEDAPNIYNKMKKYGRRNIACLTTPPAGSISLLTQTTSGIEPCFQLSYKRRKKINENDADIQVNYIDANGDKWQEFEVLHPKLKEWMRITGEKDIQKSPWYGCCAEDINWQNRVRMQAVANQNVCHSISSTVNLPEDISKEEVAKIYQTAWESGVKGITVYRKNCRTGVMVDNKNVEKQDKIIYYNAPKRPKTLPCDIYHVSVKGNPYFVLIGKLADQPYEVFAGDATQKDNIPKTLKQGYITKEKRGKYSLFKKDNNKDPINPDISTAMTEEYEVITRLLSSNLRHGCNVKHMVEQLEKTNGDLMSFGKAIARVLKKYIKDGEAVSGEECGECGSQLVRKDGCVHCVSCGWSKC